MYVCANGGDLYMVARHVRNSSQISFKSHHTIIKKMRNALVNALLDIQKDRMVMAGMPLIIVLLDQQILIRCLL